LSTFGEWEFTVALALILPLALAYLKRTAQTKSARTRSGRCDMGSYQFGITWATLVIRAAGT
jgi:hypothetical protein